MLGSKIDLFGNECLDVVFDAKNKNYGAVNLETPPPPVVAPPASKQNITKFLPPVVVESPKDPEPVMIKELANSNPGPKTVAGVEEGEIVIEGPTGKAPLGAKATEDTHVYDTFSVLEVQPTFPGGMDKFYVYLSKSIRYPAAAQEINIQGKVFVSFIIEKMES